MSVLTKVQSAAQSLNIPFFDLSSFSTAATMRALEQKAQMRCVLFVNLRNVQTVNTVYIAGDRGFMDMYNVGDVTSVEALKTLFSTRECVKCNVVLQNPLWCKQCGRKFCDKDMPPFCYCQWGGDMTDQIEKDLGNGFYILKPF